MRASHALRMRASHSFAGAIGPRQSCTILWLPKGRSLQVVCLSSRITGLKGLTEVQVVLDDCCILRSQLPGSPHALFQEITECLELESPAPANCTPNKNSQGHCTKIGSSRSMLTLSTTILSNVAGGPSKRPIMERRCNSRSSII